MRLKLSPNLQNQNLFHCSEVLQNTHTFVMNTCDLPGFIDDINQKAVEKVKEKQYLKLNNLRNSS